MNIEDKLDKLKLNRSKKIGSVQVILREDGYEINSELYGREEAIKILSESPKPESEKGYCVLTKPYSRIPLYGYAYTNQSEYLQIVKEARAKSLYLYKCGGRTSSYNGNIYSQLPWIIEWDTVPEPGQAPKIPDQQIECNTNIDQPIELGMFCPFCRIPVSSKPGRTLHVKSKHPDRMNEYEQLLESDYNEEEDELDDNDLSCPYCGHPSSSKPGRTLHVKSRHPDKYDEYIANTKKSSTMTLASDSVNLVCPICAYAASSKSGLTLHMKSKHPESLNE